MRDAQGGNRLVAALVYDGLRTFEFACVAEVFGHPRSGLGGDWYRFETVAAEPGPMTGRFGVRIQADAGLERLRDAGTIIVPGWKEADGTLLPVPDDLVDALRDAHARGARLVAVCSGAWVIAATGLLDRRHASTHWIQAEAFRRRYPRVQWNPDVLYIQEGRITTSAGSAAALDASLHIVRSDFGSRAANQIARRLVLQPHRDGTQAQFIEQPVRAGRRDRISLAMQHMVRNLREDLSVGELARLCAMSERNFMRRFKQKTGATPVDWLSTVRIAHARELLESTDLPVATIASEAGFGTATNLRHHFRRRLATNPTEYRRLAQARGHGEPVEGAGLPRQRGAFSGLAQFSGRGPAQPGLLPGTCAPSP